MNAFNEEDFDLDKLNEFNNKCVELIMQEKFEEALKKLKKAENILENFALKPDTKIEKKILILILHNIACCYQKLKDYENCVSYLEAVIFHYDQTLENKHKIKIGNDCMFSLKILDFKNVKNSDLVYTNSLGDIILQMRFSAKFHLQMCAVMSQANNHRDALNHARISALICEDNISKTFLLFNQIKPTVLHDDEISAFEEKLNEMEKIIENLHYKIDNIYRVGNLNTNPLLSLSFIEDKPKNLNKTLNKQEIEQFKLNEDLKISVRNILGIKKKDDWINYLNIGNIMYLSALNYEDLDLDSDPKFELLRDAILEKIVMLTVAYFCIATEFRYLETLDSNKNIFDSSRQCDKGEHWHSKAVEFSCVYLPSSCPLVKHYILSYHKHYTNNMQTIPEDEIINNKVEIVRANLEIDQDPILFIRTVPMSSIAGLNLKDSINTQNKSNIHSSIIHNSNILNSTIHNSNIHNSNIHNSNIHNTNMQTINHLNNNNIINNHVKIQTNNSASNNINSNSLNSNIQSNMNNQSKPNFKFSLNLSNLANLTKDRPLTDRESVTDRELETDRETERESLRGKRDSSMPSRKDIKIQKSSSQKSMKKRIPLTDRCSSAFNKFQGLYSSGSSQKGESTPAVNNFVKVKNTNNYFQQFNLKLNMNSRENNKVKMKDSSISSSRLTPRDRSNTPSTAYNKENKKKLDNKKKLPPYPKINSNDVLDMECLNTINFNKFINKTQKKFINPTTVYIQAINHNRKGKKDKDISPCHNFTLNSSNKQGHNLSKSPCEEMNILCFTESNEENGAGIKMSKSPIPLKTKIHPYQMK